MNVTYLWNLLVNWKIALEVFILSCMWNSTLEYQLLTHVWLFATSWTRSPQGSLVLGISKAGIVEWVAISFSRGISPPRDWTWVSCFAGRLYQLNQQGSPYYRETVALSHQLCLNIGGNCQDKTIDREESPIILKIYVNDVGLYSKTPERIL